MTITYHNVVQGSEEWKELRRGILTASKMPKLITPAQLKVANNDDSRAVVFDVMAERITGVVADEYQSFDMARGKEEELFARQLYSQHYAQVKEVGFVTNDEFGFTLGWSPDGLVGDDGAVENKSRNNKLQIKNILAQEIPPEDLIQVQTGLLVSRRKWVDYNSYSNGMVMWTKRIEPDEKIQAAIIEAGQAFEKTLTIKMAEWNRLMNSGGRYIPTERRNYNEEITL